MKKLRQQMPALLTVFALAAVGTASSWGAVGQGERNISQGSLSPASVSASSAPAYLYKTTFVRAAPGKLLELIDFYKSQLAVFDAAGDERPLWWRHMEGDQWDLMLLFPMGSYTEYYSRDRVSRREKAAAAAPLASAQFLDKVAAFTAWREDIFVLGPPLEAVKKEFDRAGFYHLEIFVALPGKQAELYRERKMENAYQVGIGRPATLLFVRDQGAAWDMFSLGCYRDLQHWAGTSAVPQEKKEEAARRAGFSGASAIGPYMRSLIDMHRDTMGGAIK
jgi:hypothetical protein